MSSENRIKAILDERGLKPASFAKAIGIPTSTMYSITRGNTQMENISASVFLKIARGLGMTPEELYFGTSSSAPSDPIRDRIIDSYESMNDEGRQMLAVQAEALAKSGMFAKSEDHRVSKTA